MKERRLFTTAAIFSALVGSAANIVLIQTPLGALAECVCVLMCTGALILCKHATGQLGMAGRMGVRVAVLITLAGILLLTQETPVSTFGELRASEMMFADSFRLKVHGTTYYVTYRAYSFLSWNSFYNVYTRQYGFLRRVNPAVITIGAGDPASVDPVRVFKKVYRTGEAIVDGQKFASYTLPVEYLTK
ncbi:hypothetical protein [Lacticaseibacillus daqingensis]|uniref:hypothetical protein n=1 Tax=Lacticaseibacillus daqingensis TaxID=2486014 RepID=UPI000F7B247C|nr:hypothetical protein [Lacticaseibacillus daqingensis]